MTLITPRTLKGFRDLTPAQARRREHLILQVAKAFRRHGYSPIETPALEYAEILKGKGGEESDKLLYEFEDQGGRQVALRFDLTVPLARYVAQHQGQLVFPFRRYHVGPVWRAERPQKGRFREFVQCDADLVGAVGPAADAEMLIVMDAAYVALDIGRVTLRFNDRRVLNGLLESIGATEHAVPALRALDKLDKQGADAVAEEMVNAGLTEDQAAHLLDATRPGDDDPDTLAGLAEAVHGSALGEEGVDALGRVRDLVIAGGVDPDRIQIDPRIARGLDYYTGIVFEARFTEAPAFGSVGGGGRYDDLAGIYTKTSLPGVGGSVGIDRLLAALEEKEGGATSFASADILVAHPDADRLAAAVALASGLRARGFAVEVYPQAKKHGAQMRYADRQGIRFVFTVDDDGTLHGKDLTTGRTFGAATAGEAAKAVAKYRKETPPTA